MKYVSIDIETTGLDPQNCQILTIGAVIEDTNKKLSFDEIPKFHCTIIHKNIHGEPFALNMNQSIIKDISDFNNGDSEKRQKMFKEKGLFLHESIVSAHFARFLEENEYFFDNEHPIKITVAGKNFGTFDKLFLENLPKWKDMVKIHQRIIDPAVVFADWKHDEELPNLTMCKERAGLNVTTVTHNALEDAFDVVEILRTKY